MDKHKIAKKYNVPVNRVRSEIGKRERLLGIPPKVGKDAGITYKKVVALIKKGLRNCDIEKELSIASQTASYHRQRYLKTLQK